MNYREFGKTGEKISALGFGCMRFPEYKQDEKNFVDQDKVDEMIAYAYENGVNYFDTAPHYCNSNSEAALGHAVKNFRAKILISTKCPMDKGMGQDGYRRHLERSLTRLGTDHIDFYHFWGINRGTYDNLILAENLLEAARKAKEEGLIRHISFSFHDHPSAIRYIVDTSEERGVKMESMLCQYNLLDRSNEEMIKYVNEKGLGTVAMGPVGGGRLAAPTDLYAKLTGKPSISTYELAFKFCLGNPSLNCALSGMQNLDMVQKNVKVSSDDTAFSAEEWEQLGAAMEEIKKFSELYCTGCKYCQPCPVEINIPRIFEIWTYYNVYGLKDHAKNMMKDYLHHGGKTFADCKKCGICEQKCPQHLAIRENLEKVCKILCE
ncbi:MAG: aldo/keto reductase [Clostridia bacterium]|nr:aldo/keto reductase [Clostridia bacterium]MBQ8513162.1 aldo/keto reductase [Clostridia bacterium]